MNGAGMDKDAVIRELLGLSGSTESRIYGTPRYDEIEKARAELLSWIVRQPESTRWLTWQDAVERYRSSLAPT
jgi:hypothetical protein